MMNYAWPGNVRELQSAVRFALVKSKNSLIQPQNLPAELHSVNKSNYLKDSSGKLDCQRVRQVLQMTGGNKAKAARLLDVGRATIYRFLNQHPEIA